MATILYLPRSIYIIFTARENLVTLVLGCSIPLSVGGEQQKKLNINFFQVCVDKILGPKIPLNPNGPELLKSLKLPGGGEPNGPPPPELTTIIPMLKLMSHYKVNF